MAWGNASDMLAKAGVPEDQSYYRTFNTPDERAVLTIPMRIQDAWKRNDPDVFAGIFAENGSLLMQDTQLTSRGEIRDYMAEGFSGPLKGAYVKGWPIEMRFLSDRVAIAVTEGGIIMRGEEGLNPERMIRAVWVIVKDDDGKVRLMSHQSSPVKG